MAEIRESSIDELLDDLENLIWPDESHGYKFSIILELLKRFAKAREDNPHA